MHSGINNAYQNMWLHSPHLHLFLLFLETEYKLLMLNKSPYRGWRGDAGVMERDCSWEQHLQVNTVFNPEKKWLLLYVDFSLLKEQNAPWTPQLCHCLWKKTQQTNTIQFEQKSSWDLILPLLKRERYEGRLTDFLFPHTILSWWYLKHQIQ